MLVIIKKNLISLFLFYILFFFVFSVFADSKTKTLQNINIEITTHLGDKQTFQESDAISFLLNLDEAAYLYVIYQDSEGQLIQMIPNKSQQKNYYKAGFFMSVPPQDSDFKFVVQAPFGKEILWAMASDSAEVELVGKTLKNGLKVLSNNIEAIRGKLKKHSKQKYGESKMAITTEPFKI
jgi:hypothetical protein